LETVVEKNVELPDIETAINLFGYCDQNIRILENTLAVKQTRSIGSSSSFMFSAFIEIK
jgi:hypothetical protein